MSDRLQPARITQILPDSIAAEIGFEVGDRLVSINGEKPRDLIDYRFLIADEFLELVVLDRDDRLHEVEIEKDYDQDLGLEFETALFDGLIQCNNRCPFCFIDQQPTGKRESLYFKDDDYRLSFLYGSYLTLTNLSQREWERIERLRLSPLYVSVHATNPDLRSRLLKNPRAGQILEQLAWFQARQLQIHAQVVVCPGLNDGEHLQDTLRDLARFYPGEIPTVTSVAIVPVGLTRFRPDQDELRPVTPTDAAQVIDLVQPLQAEFLGQWGSRFAWLADEWFLIAGQDLPPESIYEDYPQLENGVGSIRSFLSAFQRESRQFPAQVTPARHLTWVVGNVVAKAFQPIQVRFNQIAGVHLDLVGIASGYWGQDLTVTGLLTGQDLLKALQDRDCGDAILLPSVMLKHGETCFLDDRTVAELEQQLQVPILICEGLSGLITTVLEWDGE
ncbi:MAG: TIGR03279 family radical SAM protein [Prochlorotrichaceae cyanobacterium]|jgi:putative radical SAM enzyme (TIGR03279 family)